MEKNHTHSNGPVTFRRWSRKGYSLFRMMNNVVKIGVLSVIYHQASAQMDTDITPLIPDSSRISATVELDEIEVGATRVPVVFPGVARIITVMTSRELAKWPVNSIQEALRFMPGVDIRQRGPEGVQADISIRGGTFDQTLVLLNGINITDPQTGHHNLNIPVSFSQIERIEILEGPSARIHGPNAFSGAVNIITKSALKNTLTASYTAGNHNFSDLDVSGSVKNGRFSQTISVNRKSSSGYIPNTDFDILNMYIRSAGDFTDGRLDFQLGYTEKAFGANSFYTARYPEQFEKTRTMLTSLKWSGTSAIHLTPSVYWRRHHDRFELFRNQKPNWYSGHNYHMTDVFGISINAWFATSLGKTAIGSEIRNENIWSNVLGDPLKTSITVPGEEALFTRYKSRTGFSLFAEHTVSLHNTYFNAGILLQRTTDLRFDWQLYPGFDAAYQISKNFRLYLTAGKTLRLPTFTDLYYSGPTNAGNPELKPEEMVHAETGFRFARKGIHGYTNIYLQKGTNLIDWVRLPGEEIWKTNNHTDIKTIGYQASVEVYIPDLTGTYSIIQTISAGYNTTSQKKEPTELISYYVLDNLKHKLNIRLEHNICYGFTSGWSVRYQERNGTYTAFANQTTMENRYEPYWLLDWRLNYKFHMLELHMDVSNLLNSSYYDLGNLPQSGRWIKAGIRVRIE